MIVQSDIKIYLTSIEPNLAQTISSQSLGGYSSTTLVNIETVLTSNLGLYDTDIVLDTPSVGNWQAWSEVEYIGINNEVIKVEEVVSNNIIATTRSFNSIRNIHVVGDRVVGLLSDSMFNNVFNNNFNQYRCVAVKNTSASSVAGNTRVYFRNYDQNPYSVIKFMIEVPKTQYYTGTSDSWTSITLTDSFLVNNPSVGTWEDDQCKDAYLRILSGPNANKGGLINSYDSTTGTFVLYNELPVDYDSDLHSSNITFEVEPSPSQRVKTGTVSPARDDDWIFGWSNTAIFSLKNITSVDDSGNLNPGDIFYIWIRRNMKKTSELYSNNNFAIVVFYDI